MTPPASSQPTPTAADAITWRLITLLSIVEVGAYVGNESGRYFWDLTSYVQALDTVYPYRFEESYPFLYPPFAADLFRLARSHLFELLSIAYVAAAALFFKAFAQLQMRRQFDWLLAVFAMGGLGVVSLQSGNVALAMNFTLLGVAWRAAAGAPIALRVLPLLIALGALIKPQFIVYLGLLPFLEPSRRTAVLKMLAAGLVAGGVYAGYVLFRPFDWNEYVDAIVKRGVTEKDFAWGPAGFIKHFDDSSAAAFAAYAAGLFVVGTLAGAAWRKSAAAGQPMARVFLVNLVFVVLTFANPRLPLYDLFAAAIALAVCCAIADQASTLSRVLALALAVNLVPWLIANFARVPSAYPWWLRDLQVGHLFGIAGLLVALARARVRPIPP